MSRKHIEIDTEELAIQYIQTILAEWKSWKTHHIPLVQALELLLKAHTRKKNKKMTLEKAEKLLIEEYERAKKLEFVNDPLAYALYHVWKKADAERRENEQRKAD